MESSSVETFNKFREQLFTEQICHLRKEISDLRTEMYELRIQDREKNTRLLKYTMAVLSIATSSAVLIALFTTHSH